MKKGDNYFLKKYGMTEAQFKEWHDNILKRLDKMAERIDQVELELIVNEMLKGVKYVKEK